MKVMRGKEGKGREGKREGENKIELSLRVVWQT